MHSLQQDNIRQYYITHTEVAKNYTILHIQKRFPQLRQLVMMVWSCQKCDSF